MRNADRPLWVESAPVERRGAAADRVRQDLPFSEHVNVPL